MRLVKHPSCRTTTAPHLGSGDAEGAAAVVGRDTSEQARTTKEVRRRASGEVRIRLVQAT